MHRLHHTELIQWLRGGEWLAESAYARPFHAIFGDAPYFLESISRRFGSPGSAPAKYGRDGAFQRQSKGFMGQTWDGFQDVWQYQAWVTEWASLLLKFGHPGAVGAFYGGSRTFHRIAAGLEDAGWEIFDSILVWSYGSGFPKGFNLPRQFQLKRRGWDGPAISNQAMLQLPLHERLAQWKEEQRWTGWNFVLKPTYEPIILARIPRRKATYAELATRYGTGALWIDGTRVESGNGDRSRYPGNSILICECESAYHQPDCPVAMLDKQTGIRRAGGDVTGNEPSAKTGLIWGNYNRDSSHVSYGDVGTASRFFYTAKAQRWEREAGLEDRTPQPVGDGRKKSIDNAYQRGKTERLNVHPTVKPIRLNEYIARLLLPPRLDAGPRRILIPFAGVGSEMIGAMLAGWDEIEGVEMTAEYIPINQARLAWWEQFQTYEEAEQAYKKGLPETRQPVLMKA